MKRTLGQIFDYPGANFEDTTAGNFFDPGHYTVTDEAGGKDVGSFTAAIDVPPAHFIWTNIPDITKPLDRTQDLVVTWTGGVPGTQVTVASAGLANGVTTAFLCAAPVEAGQITIPSYVLLQIPAASASSVGGSLSVANATATLFSASGLDEGRLTYSEGYSVTLQYQ